jgi:hypothetical protein
VLIGGGDLVLPDTVSSLYWNRAWLRRPVIVSGVGVALERPPRGDVVPRMRDFVRHPSVRSISLRDRDSMNWVRDELEPLVPVRCAPDLGFAAAIPPAAPAREAVAVVLRKTPSPHDLATVDRLRRWASSQGLGLEHVVLATGITRDEEILGLRAAFGSGVALVTAETTAELSALLGGYPMVFSAKFHGLVIALRHGVPVASLRDTHKVRALADQLGDPRLVVTVGPVATQGSHEVLAPVRHQEVHRAKIRALEAAATSEVTVVAGMMGTMDQQPSRGARG